MMTSGSKALKHSSLIAAVLCCLNILTAAGPPAKTGPRIATRESIGYAYSRDGVNFVKYCRNPVATRHAEPNASAYAEVHGIIEPPFVYLYHTLCYLKPWRPRFEKRFPQVEDLGVQVLITQRPFSLGIPVGQLASLGGGKTAPASVKNSRAIPLSHATRGAITVECTFGKKADAPLRLHVLSSPDGMKYDTSDLHTFDLPANAGKTCRKTFTFSADVRFIKVQVENRSKGEPVSNVNVTATLSG